MKEFIKNLKYAWKYAKTEKTKIIIYMIISIFHMVGSIVYPFLGAKLIIDLTSNQIN